MTDIQYSGVPAVTIGQDRLPDKVDIVIWKGDFFDINVTVTSESGTPVDLSGQTPSARIRANNNDATAYDFTASLVNAAAGVVRLYLPSIVTATLTPGDYIWDFQMQKENGDTRTYMAGSVLVYKDVT